MIETVRFCIYCKCTTWHVDGVCEWSDMHRNQKDRDENDEEPSNQQSMRRFSFREDLTAEDAMQIWRSLGNNLFNTTAKSDG
jgi:hypothetical protein